MEVNKDIPPSTPLLEGVLHKCTESWLNPIVSHSQLTLILRPKRWQPKYFVLYTDRLQYHNLSPDQAAAGEADPEPKDVRVIELCKLTGAQLCSSLNDFNLLSTGDGTNC